MTREEVHKLVDEIFDNGVDPGVRGIVGGPTFNHAGEVVDVVPTEVVPARVLPEGKRVVRTKTSGDRVYLLDEVKKTRQWVTNGDILKGLGFEFSDVIDVDDAEMMKYQMGPALYKVENTDAANGPA